MPTQDNRHIVEKADFLLANLAPGGLLEPAQRNEFIQLAIDDAVAMPMMQRMDMNSPKELREKLRYEGRALRKGTEATALLVGQRSVPTTSKIELDAQLVKAETRLSYESLEDSIAKGRFEQTVREVMAQRIALDLEELAFKGDTTLADDLLSTLDGFLKQATTNIVNAGGATLQRSVLKDTLKTMPSEWRKDKRALRYFTADESNIDYQDHLGDRATPVGDAQNEELESRPYHGIQVVGVPVFPTDLGVGTDETEMVLTDPGNMLFGVWREVRIETDKDIKAGVYIIVLTARVDFKFAHEPAVVKTQGIRAV
jgi:hypothetical protein